MTKKVSRGRSGEGGNVLFLILIAVALFAALSYAVTQSSRGGGGDSGREKSAVGASEITQYPAGVRTNVIRMVINGISTDQLYFDPPATFNTGADGVTVNDSLPDHDTTDQTHAVFHPAGGAASFQYASPDLMADGQQGTWFFSGNFQVNQIGTTDLAFGSTTVNDIVAFLPGVSRAVCQRINEQLGVTKAGVAATVDADTDGIPAGPQLGAGEPTAADNMTLTNDGFPTAADADHTIGVVGTDDDFAGQPFGCFDAMDGDSTSASNYVYYHVIVER